MTAQDGMPERLGEYRLLDRIGEGGMGVVFLARGSGHKTVALKVLRSAVAGEPTARRRLAREVETMQRVRSPHVAEVIDADLTGEMPYIVTRYVPGQTLEEIVRENGPLRGEALARLACGLAEALVAVHAAGVVHRDLKPSNIMLVRGSPVVIDFGIAQGPDATRLTMTGMFMGTPGYLAPEVIEGHPSSEASDVHTWGATVAFAATGRPPFGSGPYEGIFYRIMNAQADLAGAPLPLLPLLTAALARDPVARPSASQLSAQTAALEPAALVPGPALDLPAGTGNGTTVGPAPANVTRLEEASPAALQAASAPAAPGGAALPGAPGMPAASGGPAVPGVPAALAASGGPAVPGVPAAPAPPGAAVPTVRPDPLRQAFGSPTRPLALGRPQPGDLADVLPPVRYEPVRGRAVAPKPAAGGAAPVTGAPGALDRAATATRWRGTLVFASVMIVASIAVMLPVAGTLAALALIATLRVGALVQRRTAARRLARGPRGSDAFLAVLSLPWFSLRTVLTLVLLAPFALATAAAVAGITVAASPGAWPARAIAYACGALVAFYGLGPGSRLPRRQLGRAFTALPGSPAAQAIAVTGVLVLAVAALAAAVSWPSLYWPSAQPNGMIHFAGFHLGPLRSIGLLRHTGFGHRFGLLRQLLLRQFGRGRTTFYHLARLRGH
jgi:Protein kinase domain